MGLQTRTRVVCAQMSALKRRKFAEPLFVHPSDYVHAGAVGVCRMGSKQTVFRRKNMNTKSNDAFVVKPEDALLTADQVMEMLNCSERTLRTLRDEGLPFLKLSHRLYRYRLTDINAHLSAINGGNNSRSAA